MNFKTKHITLLLAAFCAFSANIASAKPSDLQGYSAPRAFNIDSRVRAFTYSPDVIFNLPITVGMHTHIVIGDDEVLVEKPTFGETIQWRATGNEKNLYIKALQPGVKTSMTLITDKRVYQFELTSTTSEASRIQKVYFDYPEIASAGVMLNTEKRAIDRAATEEAALKKVEATTADRQFSKSDAYIVKSTDGKMDVEVYDDGVKTYMRMPTDMQDMPAVFMVEYGKLAPVNYTIATRTERHQRDVVVIERRSKEWVLKLGQTETRIFRK